MFSDVAGVVAISINVIMWGSNYVPVRSHKTYDGLLFLWYQCSGCSMLNIYSNTCFYPFPCYNYGTSFSVFVGMIAAIAVDWESHSTSGISVPWEGIVGGMVSCIAWSLFPHTMKLAGMGIGFVIWCGVMTLVGWYIGRYGFIGFIPKDPARYPLIDYLGVALCITALIVMLFVKPTLKPKEKKKLVGTVKSSKSSKYIGLTTSKDTRPIKRRLLQDFDAEIVETATPLNNTGSHPTRGSLLLRLIRQRSKSMDDVFTPSAIPATYYCSSYFDFGRLTDFTQDNVEEEGDLTDITSPTRRRARSLCSEPMSPITITSALLRPSPKGTVRQCSMNSDGKAHSDGIFVQIKELNEDRNHAANSNDGSVRSSMSTMDPLSDNENDENESVLVNWPGSPRKLHRQLAFERQSRGIRNHTPHRNARLHMNRATPRRFLGIALAVIQGLIGGNACTTPFLIWKENKDPQEDILDYVFSYCLGMYFMSSILFVAMGIYKRMYRKKWPKPVVRPAFISGLMWGIGFVAWIYSTDHLDYSMGLWHYTLSAYLTLI